MADIGMKGISVGTKVHVETGGRSLPGVVVSREFASNGIYDLYTLRIAEYSQVTRRWQVSRYGPVQAHKLTRRETHVPGLDLDERHRLQRVPEWAWHLQG
jgi:hypothetical protein